MGRTYLRYVPSGVHGLIASPASGTGAGVAVEPISGLAFTAQLESVGVWNMRRGVQVGTLTVPSGGAGGDPSARAEVTALAASRSPGARTVVAVG
jgi:U3 small nucleolar RNA-associated protein 12